MNLGCLKNYGLSIFALFLLSNFTISCSAGTKEGSSNASDITARDYEDSFIDAGFLYLGEEENTVELFHDEYPTKIFYLYSGDGTKYFINLKEVTRAEFFSKSSKWGGGDSRVVRDDPYNSFADEIWVTSR